MMGSHFKALRTLRYLKPSQVYYRLMRTLSRKYELKAGEDALRRRLTDNSIVGYLPNPKPAQIPPDLGRCARPNLEELQIGRLTLLNQTYPFQGGQDWKMIPKAYENSLWTYTLHYHEWVYRVAESGTPGSPDANGLIIAEKYLRDWLETCVPGRRNFAHYPWNSFAIACRLQWWARFYWLAGESYWQERKSFQRDFLDSYGMQANYLLRHLEWDLRGNHLMRDAAGLAWAGAFLPGEAGKKMIRAAENLATSQQQEQVLGDGTHFERTCCYQLHFLEDVAQLCVLLPEGPVRTAQIDCLKTLLDSMSWMVHPDRSPALLNDAALNNFALPEKLFHFADSMGYGRLSAFKADGARHFKDFGLVASRSEDQAMFFDVGPIGVDYQLGHAHADTLTIEMSVGGRRLIVDPGCFDYDLSENRAYDRSTAAHNTVCINGRDSSEMWHVFRVGKRARARLISYKDLGSGGFLCAASHDGYSSEPGAPIHERTVLHLPAEGKTQITDAIKGTGRQQIAGSFLIGPDWQVKQTDEGFTATCTDTGVVVRFSFESDLKLETVMSPDKYHPELGKELLVTRIGWHCTADAPAQITTTILATR